MAVIWDAGRYILLPSAVGEVALLGIIDSEEADRRFELLGLACQLFGHARHLLGLGGVLLNHLVELGDSLVYLLAPGALLVTRRAYLLDELRRLLDIRYEGVQNYPRLLGDFYALSRELHNLPGCLLAPLGELPNLGGYHGEPFSVLPGPGRLDSCVKGQKVGIPGDLVDDRYLVGDVLHRDYRLVDSRTAFLGVLGSLLSDRPGLLGVVGVLLDIRVHLLHRRGNLLGIGRLLGRPLGHLLRARGHLLASRGDVRRGRGNLSNHGPQTLDHLPERLSKNADLISLIYVDIRRKIAPGDRLCKSDALDHRPSDTQGNEDRNNDDQNGHDGTGYEN